MRDLGIESVPVNARGSGSRSYRRPEFSNAEMAMAAANVGKIPWTAALFSIAGDRSGYWTLWRALMFRAERIAVREGWQPRVPARQPRDEKTGKPLPGSRGEPRFYVSELCQLVLDEDSNRPLFNSAPALYAVCLGVDDAIWDRILMRRHTALVAIYQSWLDIAKAEIRKRIVGEEHCSDVQPLQQRRSCA